MGQAVDSEFVRAHPFWELPGYWDSSLLDLLFVFSNSEEVLNALLRLPLILPRLQLLTTRLPPLG